MGKTERQEALRRLLRAVAEIQNPEELIKLARTAELRAEWEGFVTKAQDLAAQRHKRRMGGTDLVGYDDALRFGQQTGLRQQRISRFWTALFKHGGYMRRGEKESYQKTVLSLDELKYALKHKKLSDEDRLILQLWLKVLQ